MVRNGIHIFVHSQPSTHSILLQSLKSSVLFAEFESEFEISRAD